MRRTRYALVALLASTAVVAAADETTPANETPTPGKEAGEPTSNRTPGKETPTPLPQTTKKDGQTSDRTPSNHGEADHPKQ